MYMRRQIGFFAFLVAGLMSCQIPTAESYYEQGKAHREANEPVAAMQSFVAATRVKSHEEHIKGRSFSNMATMCRMGERHDLAYALYQCSEEQFAKAKDTLAQAYALNNMAWEQAVTGNKDAAMRLIDSALTLCPKEAVYDKVLESWAAACLYAEEYDSVVYYAQSSLIPSVYLDMLCAQAFTFMEQSDSALYYARRVVTQTDNPRYLDDIYYILAYCDSTVEADDIRALASTRTDIQRNLERNDPQWIEAMLLAEESLQTPRPIKRHLPTLLCCLVFVLAVGVAALMIYRRKQYRNALTKQCLVLRESPNIREELHWNDYSRFCETCNARMNGIAEKLEKKGLSEREIRISVLVLIGFSYAEIADILYRAESGIGKDKYVIAKRLGVSVKNLQDTLLSIAKEKYHA
jgi:DNA-binding CsgD family transcriptional regulator